MVERAGLRKARVINNYLNIGFVCVNTMRRSFMRVIIRARTANTSCKPWTRKRKWGGGGGGGPGSPSETTAAAEPEFQISEPHGGKLNFSMDKRACPERRKVVRPGFQPRPQSSMAEIFFWVRKSSSSSIFGSLTRLRVIKQPHTILSLTTYHFLRTCCLVEQCNTLKPLSGKGVIDFERLNLFEKIDSK